MGDRLVVSVTADSFVRKKGRPIIPDRERAAIVRSLHCVDEVIIVSCLQWALADIVPNIFVKGNDYRGKINKSDLAFCKKYGIKVRITDTPKLSTTAIINEIRRRG